MISNHLVSGGDLEGDSYFTQPRGWESGKSHFHYCPPYHGELDGL